MPVRGKRLKRKPKSPEHRALLAFCRLQRKQIEELGHLRKLLLEMRPEPLTVIYGPRIRNPYEWPGVPVPPGTVDAR